MNRVDQVSGQGKVSLRPIDRTKLSLNLISSNTRFRSYAHKFKWNPDCDYRRIRTSRSLIAEIEQGLSPSTYLIPSYALAGRASWQHAFRDPLASRYRVIRSEKYKIWRVITIFVIFLTGNTGKLPNI